MNSIGNLVGEICKALIPIPEKTILGNQKSTIAICTLSSIDLLKKLSKPQVLQNVAIVGRLLSENKGIDLLINFVNEHPNIKTLIICGNEVWGHKTGHSLMELYKYGVDDNGQIINSISPEPVLTVSKSKINTFQNQVRIIDLIGETNEKKIIQLIKTI